MTQSPRYNWIKQPDFAAVSDKSTELVLLLAHLDRYRRQPILARIESIDHEIPNGVLDALALSLMHRVLMLLKIPDRAADKETLALVVSTPECRRWIRPWVWQKKLVARRRLPKDPSPRRAFDAQQKSVSDLPSCCRAGRGLQEQKTVRPLIRLVRNEKPGAMAPGTAAIAAIFHGTFGIGNRLPTRRPHQLPAIPEDWEKSGQDFVLQAFVPPEANEGLGFEDQFGGRGEAPGPFLSCCVCC
jgi:hypothetical protein